MHVEVDDRDAQQLAMHAVPLGLHQARGHRGVVEDTVAAALVGRGVVRAARQVGREPSADGTERRVRGRDRGTDRAARALDHRFAPRKAYFTLLRRAQRAVDHGRQIARCVSEREFAVTGRQRLAKLQAGQAFELLAQQPVLRHRKAMPRRQRQHELVGVEGLHRHFAPIVTNVSAAS